MGTFWNSNKTALLKDLTRLCPNGEEVHFSNWVWDGERKNDKELTITRRGKRIFLKVLGWEGEITKHIVHVQRYEGFNVCGTYTQQWNFMVGGWDCKCPVSDVTIYEKDPVIPEWRKRLQSI